MATRECNLESILKPGKTLSVPAGMTNWSYAVDNNAAIQSDLAALLPRTVKTRTTTAPPVGPVNGEAHIVASAATGDFAGYTERIAVWSSAETVWLIVTPPVGWRIWVEDEGDMVVWDGTAWDVVDVLHVGSGVNVGGVAGVDVSALTVVTGLQIDTGTLQMKTRDLAITGGIVVGVGDESAWVDVE
ncbi:DUF2793 domain-containing protein [Desulfovibrio inopinatus]|uniref:DUF2793 domain-containing protein n=1 Tax=Desulfovibrio inopinatus TaxID=102109 RepID=UPI0004095785|nr:DUF2793 domain-containing protein [Desulfovibrio inopinatus]